MTARGPTSFASKWLIGVLLILVASAILPGTTAHAEECLAAPNSPAREGTRWHYRLDWATQRKCWYMRAIDQPTHQTTAHPSAALPAPGLATPIPSPGPPATGSAMSVNRGNPTPPSSNREEIDTKTTAAPPLGEPTPDTIPKEFASQGVDTPLAAPASNTAPGIGTATDETTSAISAMHQLAPATAVVPDAETPTAPPQVASSSELNAQVAASGINVAPPINASIDNAVPSIPTHSVTQLSRSSEFRSAEPTSEDFVAQHEAPPAVGALNARPIPSDLLSPGREMGAPTDERIDNAGKWVPPLYFMVAFLLALVVQLFMSALVPKTASRKRIPRQ